MKKIFTFLLVLAIMVAMPLAAFAEAPEAFPPEEVTAPFIIEYGWEIFAGLVILAIVVLGVIKFIRTPRAAQIEAVRKWLLQAIIMAEKLFGSKTGEAKLSFVYDMFVSHLPWLAKIFPFSTFSGLVDNALDDMRELLEKNPDLLKQLPKVESVEIE